MRNFKLSFTKEANNIWYIDFPKWPFDHYNLMMVAGADKLCEELSYNGINTSVDVIVSKKELNKPDYIHLKREKYKILDGATYKVVGSYSVRTCWICPVTLFVFGNYPKNIYIKRNK